MFLYVNQLKLSVLTISLKHCRIVLYIVYTTIELIILSLGTIVSSYAAWERLIAWVGGGRFNSQTGCFSSTY